MAHRQDVLTPKKIASSGFVAKLSRVKEWAMTREPSGHAFEEYRMAEFKKANVDVNDPKAATKLHVATTKVPPSATKPGGVCEFPENLSSVPGKFRGFGTRLQLLVSFSWFLPYY